MKRRRFIGLAMLLLADVPAAERSLVRSLEVAAAQSLT